MTMTADHRHVLFNFVHDADHLVWLYRASIDQRHDANLTSEHMCLADFATRAAALARNLLDDDNRRRDTRAGFKPTPSAVRDRLRSALAARREALQQHAAPAATSPPPPDPPPDAPPVSSDPLWLTDPSAPSAEPESDGNDEAPPDTDRRSQRPRMRPR